MNATGTSGGGGGGTLPPGDIEPLDSGVASELGATDLDDALQELTLRSRTYTHIQSIPSTSWVVNHNLGIPYPEYTVVDTNGEEYIGIVLTPVDSNNLTVDFSIPLSGTAYFYR